MQYAGWQDAHTTGGDFLIFLRSPREKKNKNREKKKRRTEKKLVSQ
jgi:hypothetical protein